MQCIVTYVAGPGSEVGIATCYGLDGPRIESLWGARFSTSVQIGTGTHPTSFPGGKAAGEWR